MYSLRLILLLALSCAPVLAGELTGDEWASLKKEAKALSKKAGEAQRKYDLIEALAGESSARATKLLLQFAGATVERRDKLIGRAEKAEDSYHKITTRLRKKYGRKAGREKLEKDSKWRKARDARDQTKKDLGHENDIIAALGRMFAEIRAPAAVAVLADTSNRDLKRATKASEVQTGILLSLIRQPVAVVTDALLRYAGDPRDAHAQARVLDWIGRKKVKAGFDTAVKALRAKPRVVSRSAVKALLALDDPRCVPAIVQALPSASGLLAEEMELALYHYTGEQYFGAGSDAMWSGWWKSEGESWLRSAQSKRYVKTELKRKGSASFYGIETRSDRIVFVLDRSDSMRHAVPQSAPVSGSSRDTRVPGKTRIEVAKNQLARSISRLPKSAKFAVVFYCHEVDTWKKPPNLVTANKKNKHEATAWFMGQKHVGSTLLFPALHEALKYARVGGGKSATDPRGADTIYLLSDGAPTDAKGTLLTGEVLEQEIQRFLEANRAFNCVVHTIGISPQHDRALMARIARETGGTYKAVGMKR